MKRSTVKMGLASLALAALAAGLVPGHANHAAGGSIKLGTASGYPTLAPDYTTWVLAGECVAGDVTDPGRDGTYTSWVDITDVSSLPKPEDRVRTFSITGGVLPGGGAPTAKLYFMEYCNGGGSSWDTVVSVGVPSTTSVAVPPGVTRLMVFGGTVNQYDMHWTLTP